MKTIDWVVIVGCVILMTIMSYGCQQIICDSYDMKASLLTKGCVIK